MAWRYGPVPLVLLENSEEHRITSVVSSGSGSHQEFLDRRKMTEFGSLALVDEGAGAGDAVNISLPGVRRGRNRWLEQDGY